MGTSRTRDGACVSRTGSILNPWATREVCRVVLKGGIVLFFAASLHISRQTVWTVWIVRGAVRRVCFLFFAASLTSNIGCHPAVIFQPPQTIPTSHPRGLLLRRVWRGGRRGSRRGKQGPFLFKTLSLGDPLSVPGPPAWGPGLRLRQADPLSLGLSLWVTGRCRQPETMPSGARSPRHLGLGLGRVPACCLNLQLQLSGEVRLLPALLPTILPSLWANCCGLSYPRVRSVGERSRAQGVASGCLRSVAGTRLDAASYTRLPILQGWHWAPLVGASRVLPCQGLRAPGSQWRAPLGCLFSPLPAHSVGTKPWLYRDISWVSMALGTNQTHSDPASW